MPTRRYTAAMLAELVGVPASQVRRWQRRGWLQASEVKHRLALFDYTELTVARQLAALYRGGATTRLLSRGLADIRRRFPEVERPLAELLLLVDGATLLVRRGDDLLEPGGQLRLDFDALATEADEPPAILPSPAVFLTRRGDLAADAAPGQLAAWAAELDEAGDLPRAAEMYRAALAAGGPTAELCFQLAEVLYRLGDLSAARERYFQALELDEDYLEARLNLGCVLRELGEHELALSAFSGALAAHEDYADAHYHLAKTLEALGRADEAAEHWRRFLELAPDSPWAEAFLPASPES